MLNPLFVFGFTPAQIMWEAQIKLLRIFTGAFDQPKRAEEEGGAVGEFRTAAAVQNKAASKKRALERTGKGTAKRTMRLSSSAKRSRRKGR